MHRLLSNVHALKARAVPAGYSTPLRTDNFEAPRLNPSVNVIARAPLGLCPRLSRGRERPIRCIVRAPAADIRHTAVRTHTNSDESNFTCGFSSSTMTRPS